MEIGMTNFDKMFQQIIPLLDEWSDEQEIPPVRDTAFCL